MNRFLAIVLVPLIVVLPGCGALAAFAQNAKLDQVDQKLGEVAEGIQEVREIQSKAREQADVDKDGVLSGTELLTYGGLVTAGLAEMTRRKFKKNGEEKKQELDSRLADLEGMIEHERSKRKALEEAEIARLKSLAPKA